jgi:chemotaxis protein CheD
VTGEADKLFDSLRDHNRIEVGVGEIAIAQYPRYLMTPALGSCVGLALWDSTMKQGGLAHVMLPTPSETAQIGQEHRFATVAVPALAKMLADAGSPRRRLVAKIAGGSAMFKADTVLATIGQRNVEEVKSQLGLLNIPLLAEDTGESHARTVELHLDSGEFVVRSYVYGVKRL